MEAGNRCFDECLPEETNRRIVDHISDVNMCYSEHARRYLNAEGTAKERTFVTGSPMAEVLHANLAKIEASDVLERLGLEPQKYMLLSAHREENIDTEKNFIDLFTSINHLAETYDMPILYSCHPRSKKRLDAMGFKLDERVKLHEPASLPAWGIPSRRFASAPPPSAPKRWTRAALCWLASAPAAWSRPLRPPWP